MTIDYSLIISIGSLLSVLLTAFKLLSYLTKKAHEEGVKDEKMSEVMRNIDGLGRKVNNIDNEHRKTSDKVIEIESKIVTKLDTIESLLKSHIEGHNQK